MTQPLDLSYPTILQLFGRHLIAGRLESRAFLGWFLENYYRLDAGDAEDIICDGPDDKGVDGIYLDRTFEEIHIFQTKLFQNPAKTLGDSMLKEFAGTLSQFRDRASVEKIAAETSNVELRGLISDMGLPNLVDAGYTIKGVFITNVRLDTNGSKYLTGHGQLQVFDFDLLQRDWLPPGDTSPVSNKVSFHLDGLGHVRYTTTEAEVYVVPLLASELVTLSGIDNQSLFAWNVRQTLGKTKVNKAIAESIKDTDEHKNFLFYHNGLTILAEEVSLNDDDTLSVDRYTVVNGCQSLSTLYDNKGTISNELRLLARVIELPPAADLAAKITRHSNNQNSISARDLQSNSGIQKRLQEDFKRTFGSAFGYEIKRGETVECDRLITNETAAKVLLAFDLEQPWSCHQSYRYFDDLHSEIFGRPEVTASRVVGLVAVLDAVQESLKLLNNRLAANYSVTPFFMMFLVKNALLADARGIEFCQDPGSFVLTSDFETVTSIIKQVADDLVVDLNAEFEDREVDGKPFDHKRELKSATAVRTLRGQIIPSYQKAIKRNRATSFGADWDSRTDKSES